MFHSTSAEASISNSTSWDNWDMDPANGSNVTTNPKEDHTDKAQFATSPVPPPEEGPMEAPPAPPLVEALPPPQLAPLVIDRFPHGDPGAPVPGSHQGSSCYQTSTEAFGASVWAPFRSQCDWEIARWAKMRGPTSSAMEELLAIPEVVDKLGLSYSSTRELNHIIDNKLSGPPLFECRTLDLAVTPERHYADEDRTERVYSEMHTGDWWWAVQTSLEAHRPGATVVPIIISSDKTQLTLFRGRTAYPVYLTIGNIPKDIRRKPSHCAQILIAYIPTSKLEGIMNKAGRRRAMANLYHSCMQIILGPITAYGETGIEMMSGDGIWHWCHPVFASFVGDYPEQILVTCTYSGRCPKCIVPPDELGSPNSYPSRNYNKATDIYALADGDTHAFHLACREAGQKPVYHPFWEALPLTNIFVSITPDILHQLLQGVFKHLITWLIATFEKAEIDSRCRRMPLNHHIHIFGKGISGLSRVTGKEHKDMSRLLLGLVLDLPLPGGQVSQRLITAVRALLDFLFLAQFQSHTTHTITHLETVLTRFHDNKEVFMDLGVRDHFNLPKIHSMGHYIPSICLFGTTDVALSPNAGLT
ncbi:hypothetical protein EI94DRAFT_1803081 [Lactarius quietus]|nr:hypothetical protein EI94DRAFT_1803081 [Lactarius quietus]